jgi:predicted amidohydrolase
MNTVRIALASLPYPDTPPDAVARVEGAIADAAAQRAALVCFPECYVPGYRGLGHTPPAPDPAFLEAAHSRIAAAAGRARVAVILGTERVTSDGLLISALVVNADGSIAGFQDKTQIDPSEEGIYVAATSPRRIFRSGALTLGIVICHEGWRYPETVRFAAVRGAQVVFHPHFHPPEPGSYRPATFADPKNTFHEKAALCRAAENTCYFATVNYAIDGAPTTSAVIAPDGTLVTYQPYGKEGLLIADLDLTLATGLLASRLRGVERATETV